MLRTMAGSARDYLNAPTDTWLTVYNFGYSMLVTPEDSMDQVALGLGPILPGSALAG